MDGQINVIIQCCKDDTWIGKYWFKLHLIGCMVHDNTVEEQYWISAYTLELCFHFSLVTCNTVYILP